jgi:hypothetical protein
MKVLISGSTGLIGSALMSGFGVAGHEAVRLVRPGSTAPGESVAWDPTTQTVDRAALEGFDAVVHLAGENISGRRWTRDQKERIRSSRVDDTMLLCTTLASLKAPPRVLLCGSALGYYGDRGPELLGEDSGPGDDFLGRVTWEWERATLGATSAGIRVLNLRFGLVLTATGGLLVRMLPLFRFGLGGRLGNGKQYMSWISRHDAVRAMMHLVEAGDISGPVNISSPAPVTNSQFTKTLAQAVRRPALFWVPELALRISQGQITESVMASARMDATKLVASGFSFEHPDLESALSWALGDR